MSISQNKGIEKVDEGVFKLTCDLNRFDIDASTFTEFTGVLDGNGYTIESLSNTLIEELTGKIKNVVFTDIQSPIIKDNSGIVENVEVNGADISGDVVGCICERNKENGRISHCKVTEADLSGKNIGLISSINLGEIKDCYTDGTAKGNIAGGICSNLNKSGTVINCTSSADLFCDWHGGGIIGSGEVIEGDLIVEDCLFDGKIKVQGHGGGVLVGGAYGDRHERIYKNCEVDCMIISEEDGLRADKILNCDFNIYFETECDVVEGVTLIKNSNIDITIENMLGHMFNGDTRQNELINSSFLVKLKCLESYRPQKELEDLFSTVQKSEVQLKFCNVSRTIQQVSSEEQLRNCSKYDIIYLTDDITITEDKPVFTVFYGLINGSNYTLKNISQPLSDFISSTGGIYNLTIKFANITDSYTRTGILSRLNKGIIQSISITDSKVEVHTESVGSICGENIGQIQDSTVSNVTVRGEKYIGGLAGRSNVCKNCMVENTSIKGEKKIGGALGQIQDELGKDPVVKDITVKNTIIEGNNKVGGCSGTNAASVSDILVKNTYIEGDKIIGGFSGITGGTVQDAHVRDSIVEGNTEIGGLVGKIQEYYQVELTDCYSNCEIIGIDKVGGFAADVENSIIKNCISKGVINGSKRVAGFIAKCTDTEISNSFNKTLIKGDQRTSSFICTLEDSTAKKSFSISLVNSSLTSIIEKEVDSTLKTFLWSNCTTDVTYERGTPVDSTDPQEFKTMSI